MSIPTVTPRLVTAPAILLIDLSSIAHPIWHMASAEPDPNVVSQRIVARVRALAGNHPAAAVCCDAGRSFRKDLAASYKANRPEQEAGLHHQIRLAIEILEGDGFPVWSVPGFEADDLIATAVTKALAIEDATVTIASSDKDLLQLVCPRVQAMSMRDGTLLDSEAVAAKFGVQPVQMRDYLTMVGDASDNVKGIKGIGPKRAAELLGKFGSLDDIYRDLTEIGPVTMGLTPAIVTALKDFKDEMPTTRALITLRDDVDIPFNEIFNPRIPREAETFGMDEDEGAPVEPQDQPPTTAEPAQAPTGPTAIATREPDVLAPAPAEWERQLEPRSMGETIKLAKYVFESRLFSAYGTPQAVMTTLLAGRELGLQSMASLRALHIVEGRPTLAADLIRALVIKSGAARYFRCVERSATRATFETQRGDDPPIALTYTIEEATLAGVVKPKSGWVTNPADMLVARASAKLARLVYPDVVHGIYTPEEMYEARDMTSAVA